MPKTSSNALAFEPFDLPDPYDRHVIAAAVAADASIILTWNLRDFPPTELKKFGLRRETPDAFLAGLYDKFRSWPRPPCGK